MSSTAKAGTSTFTVALELPDLCEPGDREGDAPATPLDAVREFITDVERRGFLWAYKVTDDATGVTYIVDMDDETVSAYDDEA